MATAVASMSISPHAPDASVDPDAAAEPQDIPDEWKQARAARAQAWFSRARDEAATKYHELKQKEAEAVAAAGRDARAASALAEVAAAHAAVQRRCKVAADTVIQTELSRLQQLAASAQHSWLKFPHSGVVRPIMVLAAATDKAPFRQQLLARGIVCTLLASASVQACSGDASDAGLKRIVRPGCGGTDLLNWEPFMPRGPTYGPTLFRMEALAACRVCVLVLSSSLLLGPNWDSEQKVLAARLLQQQEVKRPLALVVIRVPESPLTPLPDLPIPEAPSGVTNSTHVVVIDLRYEDTIQDQVRACVQDTGLQQVLKEAVGVCIDQNLDVHFTPALAVQAAAAKGHISASDSLTRNGLARLGCEADSGASALEGSGGLDWVLAHNLILDTRDAQPTRAAVCKPLQRWTVADVAVWSQSLGAATAGVSPMLARYGVDGQLLSSLTLHDLQYMCSSAGAEHQAPTSALKLFSAVIVGLQQAQHGLDSTVGGGTAADLPVPSSPILLTRSRAELEQVFLDVAQYYDVDCSGDLSASELKRLLNNCGIALHDDQLSAVMAEYASRAGSGALPAAVTALASEGAVITALMWDVWLLLLAAQDVVAWNVPAAWAADADLTLAALRATSVCLSGTHQLKDSHAAASSSNLLRGSLRARVSVLAAPDARGASAIRLPASMLHASVSISDSRKSAAGSAASLKIREAGCKADSAGIQVHATPSRVSKVSFANRQRAASLASNGTQGEVAHQQQPCPSFSQSSLRHRWSSTAATLVHRGEDGCADDHDLEAFLDPALLTATQLRITSDPVELEQTMRAAFTAADLRRTGKLSQGQLRNALAGMLVGVTPRSTMNSILASVAVTDPTSKLPAYRPSITHDWTTAASQPSSERVSLLGGGSPASLTPVELRLLVDGVLHSRTNDHMRQLVDVQEFMTDAVRAIMHSQRELLRAVYHEGQGSQRLLCQLYEQLDPGGGSRAHTDLQLLKSAAPVLLDLLVEHQAEHGSAPLGVGTGAGGLGSSWAATRCGTVRPTFLVKAGILAEAHAAAARYLGTGNELQAWSCTAAHMLHAWGVLKACQGAAAT